MASAARRRRRPRARERRSTLAGGQEREVREVLVVDRVELVLLDQPERGAGPRSSPRRRGASTGFMPATKSLRSGTCAKTLFATSRSALPALASTSRDASSAAEELDDRLDPPLAAPPRRRSRPARCRAPVCPARRRAGAGSRRCSPARSPGSLPSSPKRSHHRLDVVARVSDPGVRVGREVRVLA